MRATEEPSEVPLSAGQRHPALSAGRFTVAAFENLKGVRITRRVGSLFYQDSLVLSPHGEEPETRTVDLPSPFSWKRSVVYSVIWEEFSGSAPPASI